MVVRMELEVYAELRKEFVKVAKFHLKPAALRQLKIHYEVAINSVRASDYVDTIEDLIRILEKRGVIRYNQIVPLKHIAKTYLSNSVIVDKLNEYESWLKNYDPPYSPLTNLYRSNNVQYVPKPTAPSYLEDFHGQPSTSSNSYLGSGTPRNQDPYSVGLQKLPKKERELQERVFQIVSRDLGRFWRDVARYLGVRESDINKIEAQYPDFQQKTYEALKIFAVESDPSRWKPNLKKALTSGRRNDLVEKVDDVLSWPQFN